MSLKKIILIGGGGHCKSCIEVIESENRFEIAGIIDIKENVNKTILGYKVIGTDNDLVELKKIYDYAIITIGQIKSNDLRVKLFEKAKAIGYILPVIKASTAYVSKYTEIGEGTIVMHQAFINSSVSIGINNIINTKAIVEHDVYIGNNNHISTASVLNGNATIGNNCFIGSNSSVSNGKSISNNIIIGQGSNVCEDIKNKGIYIGNPSKTIINE